MSSLEALTLSPNPDPNPNPNQVMNYLCFLNTKLLYK